MFTFSVIAVVLILFLHWIADCVFVDFTDAEVRMLYNLYVPVQHVHTYVQVCTEVRVRVPVRAGFKCIVSSVLSSNEIACKLQRSSFAYLEILAFQ